MEIKNLNNIQSAFSYVRGLTFISIIASTIISVASVISAYLYAEKQREKVYVLDNGKAYLMALSQNTEQNRPAEAKEHVRRFHELFFTLSPDKSQIQSNIERALLLADKSAYSCYMDISESGFYNRIISANITQTISVDSIDIDYNKSPYEVVTYSTQKIMRRSIVTIRNLVTECKLSETSRSFDNPNGYLIEDFKVINNKDIETIER